MWDPLRAAAVETWVGWSSVSVQSCPVISLDSVRRKDMCGHCPVVPQANQPSASCCHGDSATWTPEQAPQPGPREQGTAPGVRSRGLSGRTEDSAGRHFSRGDHVGEWAGPSEKRQREWGECRCSALGGGKIHSELVSLR